LFLSTITLVDLFDLWINPVYPKKSPSFNIIGLLISSSVYIIFPYSIKKNSVASSSYL